MQPYFLPYIGYFQLIKSVDTFVVFDDVNYYKKGWINKNNFLVNGDLKSISIPLSKPSQNKLIKDINIFYDKQFLNIISTLKLSYKKSTNFNLFFPKFEDYFNTINSNTNISDFNVGLIKIILTILNIETNIIISSKINYNRDLKGEEKIIEICKVLGSNSYYNAPGGVDLYNSKNFKNNNIKLNFITPIIKPYNQNKSKEFIKFLSIFDFIMNVKINDINLLTHKI